MYSGAMYYSELGYDEYDDYLVGPEWREIKRFFYENRKQYACDICGAHQQIVLHKRSYKFLSLSELRKRYRGDRTKIMRYLHTYMVYLCRGCNKKVHFYPSGERVPLEYRKLKEREDQVRRGQPKADALHGIAKHRRPAMFLGSYFQRLIKR
jgi:hypothetical protein